MNKDNYYGERSNIQKVLRIFSNIEYVLTLASLIAAIVIAIHSSGPVYSFLALILGLSACFADYARGFPTRGAFIANLVISIICMIVMAGLAAALFSQRTFERNSGAVIAMGTLSVITTIVCIAHMVYRCILIFCNGQNNPLQQFGLTHTQTVSRGVEISAITPQIPGHLITQAQSAMFFSNPMAPIANPPTAPVIDPFSRDANEQTQITQRVTTDPCPPYSLENIQYYEWHRILNLLSTTETTTSVSPYYERTQIARGVATEPCPPYSVEANQHNEWHHSVNLLSRPETTSPSPDSIEMANENFVPKFSDYLPATTNETGNIFLNIQVFDPNTENTDNRGHVDDFNNSTSGIDFATGCEDVRSPSSEEITGTDHPVTSDNIIATISENEVSVAKTVTTEEPVTPPPGIGIFTDEEITHTNPFQSVRH